MTTIDPSATASDTMTPFPSLTALREAHTALLERRRDGGETPALLDEIAALVERGAASGALLDADSDRRAAQGLLDFWSNLLYRAGHEPPDATLAEFDPNLAPALDDARCPYLGLDAFHEDNAALFFGRQRLVNELVSRLSERRLLAVAGPSGSGKSSLVRAGLIPALKGGALPGSETWRYLRPIVPSSEPLASLERVLRTENRHPRGQPRTDDEPAVLGSPVVLVVDQFEEVFTLCEDEDARQVFIARLLEMSTAPGARHIVVLTMRSDFEAFVARVPELQAAFEEGRVQVTPLSAGELREAIEQPAARIGLKFEAGLVDQLLADILGEPAALPLLQFTLLKLWEQRERNRITLDAYRKVGGGRLALARSADAFYNVLIPEEQVTARRILLRMVRPGEGLEVTSSRVRRTALYRGGEDPGRVDRVLEKLIRARLVRLTPGEPPGDNQIEVAHEALVRNWPRLVEWLDEERAALAVRRRLEGRAAEWVRLGQGSGGLLDAVELHEAERWLHSPAAADLGYDPALPALVEASRAAIEVAERERETARQRELELAQALAAAQARTARRLRRAAIALLMLLALALAATGVALFQENAAETQGYLARTAEAQAQNQRNIAQTAQAETQSLARAGESLFELDDRPERALLLALASVSTGRIDSQPIISRAFYRAFEDSLIRRSLLGHTASVRAVAWSPDGRQLLSGGDDQTVRLWDVATGATLRTLAGHTGPVRAVAWSPDGHHALTAGADGIAYLWDVTTGDVVHTLKGHIDWISSVAWSPDGRQVLTGSYDKTARIWDATTGQELRTLQGHVSSVRSVAWSPDGQQVLTGSDDRTARIWDAATGRELRTLQGHMNVVSSVAWSPDGRQVLTGSGDGTARIWDAATGTVVHTLQGHLGWVWSSVWSPDGRQVLTGSFDGTARIWDAATGTVVQTLHGHSAKVWAVAWNPKVRRLATGSDDTTIRIWDVTTGVEIRPLQEATEKVLSMAWSPDRRRVLTGSDDNTARIWDVATGALVHTLPGHTAKVSAVQWSLDERQILTGSQDKTVRIWDVATRTVVHTLQGHTAKVNALRWSPDGRQVLTGSEDKTARIWDAATGTELRRLEGHTGGVWSVAWSPDGRQILTGSDDRTARIWDVATGAVVHTFQGHTSKVWSVTWSPDGRQILTGSDDGTARIWDAAAGTEVRRLVGHTGGVLSVTWSPDGRQVLTGSDDGTARIWDVATGDAIRTLEGHSFVVGYVAWSQDGRQVLTGSGDGMVRIWLVSDDLIIADITRRVCGLFNDNEIRTEITQWRGCSTELAAVAGDVVTYDSLQDGN